MKIIDIAEFYSPQGGGVRTYIDQKLRIGRALGHDVAVIAPGPETRLEEREGGHIHWIKGPKLAVDPRYHWFGGAKVVWSVLEREEPDLVEGSSPWEGAWIAARWRGSAAARKAARVFFIHQDPVAVYPHTFLDRFARHATLDRMFEPFWAYLRNLARRFDASVVSSPWLSDRLAAQGLPKPHAVRFGIEQDRFSPSLRNMDRRRDMLAACGVDDEDVPLLITVSRHHPEKRLPLVIKAFEKASKTRPLALFLIGDGLARASVERAAKGVRGLHLAGVIKDRALMSRSLASADLMLHGGAAETYGLVIAEGLSSGLPLVVPHLGGAADLAGDGYARIYRTGDSDDAAQAILAMLAQREANPDGVARAVQAAVATRLRTPDDHFAELFSLYECLALERRARLGDKG